MCNTSNDGRCIVAIERGKFGLKLFKNVVKNQALLICSPVSVEIVLMMCCAGAAGETSKTMMKILSIKELNTVCEKFKKISEDIKNIKSVTIHIANKMYVQTGYDIKQSFKDTIQNQLLSEVEEINFGNSENSVQTINNWVESKTNNKIQDLIKTDDINDTTKIILINAIYMKGNWKIQFNSNNTRESPFYLSDGTEKQVEMMHNESRYSFTKLSGLKSEILELYYMDKDISMLIILPDERNGITQLKENIEKLNVTKLDKGLVSAFIALPKLTIKSQIVLEDTLTQMGLGIIFDSRADFSNISGKTDLAISSVIQKAFVEVNEEGTEAAAATAARVLLKSAGPPPEPVKDFIVDHEFLFAIKYKDNVLFMGAYS